MQGVCSLGADRTCSVCTRPSPRAAGVPQEGKARDDGDYVDAYYPKSKDGASFYASLQPSRYAQFGGNNALQIPVTWEMFQLHNKVVALSVALDNGTQANFSTLCYKKKSGGCDLAGGCVAPQGPVCGACPARVWRLLSL